jgi:hypothetical protein|tara:strand:+ start:516 stop:815 length:300 start_codon:yes stop_codon:yes gene_type:complete
MKKVELGGQKRPIRFSYLALKEICNDCKLKLSEMNQLGTEIDHIGIIAYYGLKYGAKKIGEPFKFKVSDVENWLDNEDFNKMTEIFEAFQLDQPQSEGK